MVSFCRAASYGWIDIYIHNFAAFAFDEILDKVNNTLQKIDQSVQFIKS